MAEGSAEISAPKSDYQKGWLQFNRSKKTWIYAHIDPLPDLFKPTPGSETVQHKLRTEKTEWAEKTETSQSVTSEEPTASHPDCSNPNKSSVDSEQKRSETEQILSDIAAGIPSNKVYIQLVQSRLFAPTGSELKENDPKQKSTEEKEKKISDVPETDHTDVQHSERSDSPAKPELSGHPKLESTASVGSPTWQQSLYHDGSDPACRTLDQWLKEYSPNLIQQNAGDDYWIYLNRLTPNSLTANPTPSSDIPGLKASWRHLVASRQPISVADTLRLAKQHHVIDGMWIIFVQNQRRAAELWYKIARAAAEGSIPSDSVHVSQRTHESEGLIICVRTPDFSDSENVAAHARALRRIGVREEMTYKPVVHTHFKIFHKNKYYIRPTIYRCNNGQQNIKMLY